jgi:hypothetical protein
MSLIFYDAAFPPSVPPKTDGVCVYIGGDTPHIWSKGEIDAQPARYRLPVFVRSDPPGPGAGADTVAAISYLKYIGAPTGILVAWDMETAMDFAYINEVYQDLRASGYKLIVYGSQSTVMGNDNPDGLYWGADWTDVEHLHSGDVITQFASFAAYDESEAESGLPFWDTQHVDPTPPTNWEEELLNSLPTLQKGASDAVLPHWFVHRIQAVLNAVYHQNITIDGAFGPDTEAAVKNMQTSTHLTVDGIVGPATWAQLYAGG